jgi:hypothetical protein
VWLIILFPFLVLALTEKTTCGLHYITSVWHLWWLFSGIIMEPLQLVILMGAVVVLIVQALIINRLAGIPYPLWKP